MLRAQLEAITDDLHRWGLSTSADGTRLTAAQLRHDALIEMARRASASATTTNVRRDARNRAEQTIAQRNAAKAAAAAGTDGAEATATPTADGSSGTTADGAPADGDTDQANGSEPARSHLTQAPGTTAGDDTHPTSTPGPTAESTGSWTATDRERAPAPWSDRGLPAGDDNADPHDEPTDADHDPRSTELEQCSTLTAAQGLLLPPSTGPPGSTEPPDHCGPGSTGPPDDKVAGGLGRPLFVALIDLDTLERRDPTDLLNHRAEAVGVGPLPHHAIRRSLCDAGISRVVTRGASLPLDVGAVSRTATPAQWRALIAHSERCEFPGCTAPWEWCEAHHLDHWTRTHRTALDDLALECHGHHNLLHQPGWSMTRNDDLTITVTRPDGTTLTDPTGD